MNDWNFEIVVRVKGPKEGAQTIVLKQEDTTKEHALAVQEALTLLGAAINSGKLSIEQLGALIKG